MERHVLVIFPHPDDETFGVGGTLALHVKEGTPATYLCATLGEMGRRMGKPFFANRETLPEVRERELREACRILGINLRLMGLRDKTLEFEDPEFLADRVMEVIKELNPSKVIAFYPDHAVHPDHNALGRAVARAIKRMPPAERPVLWCNAFGDTVEKLTEQLGQPVFVDISEVLETKWAALKAHRTQTEAMVARIEKRLVEEPDYREQWERERRRERFWVYDVDLGRTAGT